jgi:hypothetical protein
MKSELYVLLAAAAVLPSGKYPPGTITTHRPIDPPPLS